MIWAHWAAYSMHGCISHPCIHALPQLHTKTQRAQTSHLSPLSWYAVEFRQDLSPICWVLLPYGSHDLVVLMALCNLWPYGILVTFTILMTYLWFSPWSVHNRSALTLEEGALTHAQPLTPVSNTFAAALLFHRPCPSVLQLLVEEEAYNIHHLCQCASSTAYAVFLIFSFSLLRRAGRHGFTS